MVAPWFAVWVQMGFGMFAGQISGTCLKSFSVGPDGDRFVGGLGGVTGAQLLKVSVPAIVGSAGSEFAEIATQLVASIGGGACFAAFFGVLAGRADERGAH